VSIERGLQIDRACESSEHLLEYFYSYPPHITLANIAPQGDPAVSPQAEQWRGVAVLPSDAFSNNVTTVHAYHIAVLVAVFHVHSSSRHPGLKVQMADDLRAKVCGFFEQREERRVLLHGL